MEYLQKRGGKHGMKMMYELLVKADENSENWQIGLIEVEQLKKK